MLGLKTSHADILKNNEACVKLESFKFVSHSNPRLQNQYVCFRCWNGILEVTLQIVNENIHSGSKNKSAIVKLEDDYPFELISQHIKTKTKDCPVFMDSVTKVSFNNIYKIHSLNSDIGLIITSIDSLEKFLGLCDNSSSFILARSIGKQTPKISDGLVVVIEQQFDNEKLLLLRKFPTPVQRIQSTCIDMILIQKYREANMPCYCSAVSVEGKAPVIYLAGDEHNWPQQLKTELKISNGYNTRVYVVITAKAPVDGRTLIQQLSNEPKADKTQIYIYT
uniref:Uncharacterized protein n=1 Tax=Timema douglasi TaxID=61478 RepID=A0A7R8VTE1_TIMDO|nr:unnamed protein product [Timema douglasi]